MTYILIAAFVVALFWLLARSIERTRSRERAVEAASRRVTAEHGLDEVYVSEDDGSLIGLSAERRILVLGGKDGDRVVPFDAIRLVEGVRNGTVLVRAERDGPALAPARHRESFDLPERISALTLRITVEGPDPTEHAVLFLDGGKHGLEPHNSHLRQQAALAEAWYRKVVEAMRPAD